MSVLESAGAPKSPHAITEEIMRQCVGQTRALLIDFPIMRATVTSWSGHVAANTLSSRATAITLLENFNGILRKRRRRMSLHVWACDIAQRVRDSEACAERNRTQPESGEMFVTKRVSHGAFELRFETDSRPVWVLL